MGRMDQKDLVLETEALSAVFQLDGSLASMKKALEGFPVVPNQQTTYWSMMKILEQCLAESLRARNALVEDLEAKILLQKESENAC